MNIETYLWYLYKPYKTEFILAFPVWQQQESKRSYWVGPEELANKACSRILKPQTFVHLAKKTHTHAHEHPTQPQESPLSKYSRQLPDLQTHTLQHSVPSNQGETSQT